MLGISILLIEDIGVSREKKTSVCHWQTSSHKVVSHTLCKRLQDKQI